MTNSVNCVPFFHLYKSFNVARKFLLDNRHDIYSTSNSEKFRMKNYNFEFPNLEKSGNFTRKIPKKHLKIPEIRKTSIDFLGFFNRFPPISREFSRFFENLKVKIEKFPSGFFLSC